MRRLREWWSARTRSDKLLMSMAAVIIGLALVGPIVGGLGAARDQAAIASAYSEVHAQWPEAITDWFYDSQTDNLLLRAGADVRAPAAKNIACNYVLPALEAHDLAGLPFRIYSPTNAFLATGFSCPEFGR